MKFTIDRLTPQEIEATTMRITVPVRFGDEQMPYDFPLRKGDTWEADIDIETGQIKNWEKGRKGEFFLKVVDEGIYTLFNAQGLEVAKIEQDYVPNDAIPGEYGDYIDFQIDENGVITNWYKNPDFLEFFQD